MPRCVTGGRSARMKLSREDRAKPSQRLTAGSLAAINGCVSLSPPSRLWLYMTCSWFLAQGVAMGATAATGASYSGLEDAFYGETEQAGMCPEKPHIFRWKKGCSGSSSRSVREKEKAVAPARQPLALHLEGKNHPDSPDSSKKKSRSKNKQVASDRSEMPRIFRWEKGYSGSSSRSVRKKEEAAASVRKPLALRWGGRNHPDPLDSSKKKQKRKAVKAEKKQRQAESVDVAAWDGGSSDADAGVDEGKKKKSRSKNKQVAVDPSEKPRIFRWER